MLLLQQMIVLFILMAIGYFCYKKCIITQEVNRKLSAIVINIANPALVLSGCMGEDRIQGRELLITMLLAVIVYAILLLLAWLIPTLLHIEKKSFGVYRAMTVFSNIGFMGFPVIAALYGRGALLYAAIYTIPFNILIYTYGIAAMRVQEDVQKPDLAPKSRIKLRGVLNIGVISCIVTIIIYLSGIKLPSVIESTITHLSNLTAPISMMVIGASLATMNLRQLFTDWKLMVFSLIKLLIIPVAGIFLVSQLVDSKVICGVTMIMLATPVGSMTAMLAQEYGGDYEMASKGVALTTILSVATMPLVNLMIG